MPFIPLESTDQTSNANSSEPVTQRGFIPLSNPDAEPSPTELDQNTDPARVSVLRNVLLNNPLTAIAETALNLGTMGVALPAAGLAGLGTMAGNALGLTDRNPVDVVQSVSEGMTYAPRGEMGQGASEIATYPFQKLAEAGQYAGGKTLDATGSPVLATAVDTTVNALPMLIAPASKLARRVKERPQVEPVDPVPVDSIAPENAAYDANQKSATAINDNQIKGAIDAGAGVVWLMVAPLAQAQ